MKPQQAPKLAIRDLALVHEIPDVGVFGLEVFRGLFDVHPFRLYPIFKDLL